MSGGGEVPGSLRSEFWAMLKICTALRDNTKVLLNANLTSRAAGHTRDDALACKFTADSKSIGQGMGAALNTASASDAYILSDRATWST